MGKAKDLFKKIGDTRKMVMITLYAKQKKRSKKAKGLADEALQIAEKRREPKGKGEKER